MSKIFDNIETNFEEGLHAIPESADRAGLLKVGGHVLQVAEEGVRIEGELRGTQSCVRREGQCSKIFYMKK